VGASVKSTDVQFEVELWFEKCAGVRRGANAEGGGERPALFAVRFRSVSSKLLACVVQGGRGDGWERSNWTEVQGKCRSGACVEAPGAKRKACQCGGRMAPHALNCDEQ
jgi:hypothetical protein